MDFVSSAELGYFAGGGQVWPQAFKPLVADDVRRVVVARSGSPLAIGIPRVCQACAPRATASARCECRLEIIWCLCSEFAASHGNHVSAISLTMPKTPAVDAPAATPRRPIVAMLIG